MKRVYSSQLSRLVLDSLSPLYTRLPPSTFSALLAFTLRAHAERGEVRSF